MATFSTGSQGLNQGFSALAQALFPDPATQMSAVYRQASAAKAAADRAKAQQEMQLEAEQAAAARAAAPALAEVLIDQNLGSEYRDLPGVSDIVAGPPAPSTEPLIRQEEFYRAAAPAIALAGTSASDLSRGLGRLAGSTALMAPELADDEGALRRLGTLYTGTAPSATTAYTPEQVENLESGDRETRLAIEREKARLGTGTQGQVRNYYVPGANGEMTVGRTRDGLTDIATGEPIPSSARVVSGAVPGDTPTRSTDTTVRNYYVPGPDGQMTVGRTRDGVTDLTTGQPIPSSARVVSGAVPGDQPPQARLQVYEYTTADGRTGISHDGGLTDAQTGETLPPNTRIFRTQVTGSQDETGTGLQNATERDIEQRLVGIQSAKANIFRLRNMIASDPRVVGAAGSFARVAQGLVGQVQDVFGGAPGEPIATREEWIRALNQAAGDQLGTANAAMTSVAINTAVMLARAAESGGRLSDQDIARQFERLGLRPSASGDQALAAIQQVLNDLEREDVLLRDIQATGQVPATADPGQVVSFDEYLANRAAAENP